jgi:hypothetical protein
MPNLQQRVDETAFMMLHLAPADRERCFCDAFNQALANHPEGLTEHDLPRLAVFVAAVFRRIAEMEQRGGTA